MFGRKHDGPAPPDTDAAVEVHVEWDIAAAQQAVTALLPTPGDSARQALLAALETLDSQLDLGDRYAQSIVDSPIFGQAPKGSVLGETSSHSMAEEVPATVFRLQIALVRAAKDAVRDPNPAVLERLRAAEASLTAATGPG